MSESFESYCIVELFGHQKIAGKVTEQVIAGQGFVRVDIPETKRYPAFTRMFGPGAIYSMTPVSEEIAMRAAQSIYAEPVTVYIEPSRQLPDYGADPVSEARMEDGGPDDEDDEAWREEETD